MRRTTLKQLRALRAIAREGKIVSAAKRLNLTPPAVTLQIQQLEAEVGLPLFDRTSDGLRPTDAGRIALAIADEIESLLAVGEERIQALKGVDAGTVAVGVVSTAKYFAPRLIAAFRRERPGVEARLMVGNRGEVIEALRSFQIDVAVMGQPPRDLPVEAATIGDHPLVVVAPPEHPLVGRRHLRKSALAGETFLVREAGSGTRTAMESFLADLAGAGGRVEMGSNETIKQAVMAGLGIAFISAHTIAAELESGRLRLLDVVGLPIRRQWFVVRRADRSLSPAAEAFAAFLAREGSRHLPFFPLLYDDRPQEAAPARAGAEAAARMRPA